MRDPKRIKRVLAEVEKVWAKYPDLRLGQLLGNTVLTSKDIYYVEDDDLITLLKIYEEQNEKTN